MAVYSEAKGSSVFHLFDPELEDAFPIWLDFKSPLQKLVGDITKTTSIFYAVCVSALSPPQHPPAGHGWLKVLPHSSLKYLHGKYSLLEL